MKLSVVAAANSTRYKRTGDHQWLTLMRWGASEKKSCCSSVYNLHDTKALTFQQEDELQAQQVFAQLHVGSGIKPVCYLSARQGVSSEQLEARGIGIHSVSLTRCGSVVFFPREMRKNFPESAAVASHTHAHTRTVRACCIEILPVKSSHLGFVLSLMAPLK